MSTLRDQFKRRPRQFTAAFVLFFLGFAAFLLVAFRVIKISEDADMAIGAGGAVLTIAAAHWASWLEKWTRQKDDLDCGAPEGGRRPSGSYLPGTERRS